MLWDFKIDYLKNEQLELTDFLHGDTDSQKLKTDQNFLGGHSQKWMWPVWSWDSKIDCLQHTGFLHPGTNSEKLKVDSVIFG